MKTLRTILLLIVVLLVGVVMPAALLAADDPTAELRTIHSPEAGFTIRFPTTNRLAAAPPRPETGLLSGYLLAGTSSRGLTQHVVGKAIFKDAEAASKGWRSVVTVPWNYSQTTYQPVRQAGLRGTDVITHSRSNGGYAYVRVLMDGATVYFFGIEAIEGENEETRKLAHAVVDSFKLDATPSPGGPRKKGQ